MRSHIATCNADHRSEEVTCFPLKELRNNKNMTANSHSEQWKQFVLATLNFAITLKMGHSHLTAPTSQLPNTDILWLLSHSPHRPYISNFQMQTFCGCCHTVLTDSTTQTSKCRFSVAAFHSSQTLHLKFPAADFLWLLHTPHKLCISPWRGCGKAHP